MREDTIEICHLKKAYGEHVIFSNLTMELKKGAVTCLMAPSGAGKTTLLRILAGLEQADGGKIGGLEALRKSMVFQEPRLAEELTAAANIQLAVKRRMFGKEKRSSRHLVEEMEELGLSGCENQAVSELSGGMRQRVAVLRAMRMDADFLLLDEPFRGLDAGTKKKTMNYIRRKGKEKTMLLVTHDLEEAEAMGGLDLHLQQTGWYPRNKEKQKKQHRNLKRKETDFLCCFFCESAVTAGHPVWKQSGAVRPSCR